MPRLTFQGPGHLLVAFGRTIARGVPADFTDSEARSLAAQPRIRMAYASADTGIPDDVERPSAHGSRRQWAAFAAKRDVAVTERMTRDDIVAAVDSSTAGQ